MTKKQIRKEFNPEYSRNHETFFTEYEKYLEQKILAMEKENFGRYMRLQKEEMEKYKYLESEKAGHDLGNECCQQWIEKYAESFAVKYWGKKKC